MFFYYFVPNYINDKVLDPDVVLKTQEGPVHLITGHLSIIS